METITESRTLFFAPYLADEVEAEFRADASESIPGAELAIMHERNEPLAQLYQAIYSAARDNYGEVEAKRAATGYLFAHRLLCYANYGDGPLPFRSLESGVELIGRASADAAVLDVEFDKKYADYPTIKEKINSFRFSKTRDSAKLLLVLYGDSVIEPTLSNVIDRTYAEVKDSDFERFQGSETSIMAKSNPQLFLALRNLVSTAVNIYPEEEVRKFSSGLLLAFRLLEYLHGNKLPTRTDADFEAMATANFREPSGPQSSKLEAAFKERFSEHPAVLELVYSKLTQLRTRYGVEIVLLTYADLFDEPTRET